MAHLFDVEKAAPKRQPTEAQRQALAKATREHQLRAAERRGVDRAEFDEPTGDPGPAWNTEPVNAFSASAPVNAFAAVAEHEREEEMER